MKSFLFILLTFLFCSYSFSQDNQQPDTSDTEETTPPPPFSVDTEEDYGWNDRISFFIGAGTSYITDNVYENPVVDRNTNHVQIELAGRVKPNVSMGIVYTPLVYDIIRTISYVDEDGELKELYTVEHVPRHLSVALFINPVSLTSTTSGLNSTIDLGFGLGWRSGSFSVFGTIEFFGLQQPRTYFIEKYKGNNSSYIVDGQIQTSLDLNDASIFKKEVFTALGLKLAYTFDVAKKYTTAVGTGL